MKNNLNILITGASRGIGNAITQKISWRAKKLFMTSHYRDRLDSALLDIKKACVGETYGLNIEQAFGEQAANEVLEWIESKTDWLDVLILCGGDFIEGDLCTISNKDFNCTLQTNFMFNYYLVKQLVPILKRSKCPRIIIIGSTASYSAYFVPSYGVAKWALRGLAVNLREELSKDNIGVTFLSPGGTLTDMWSDVNVPENRLLEPEDIAKTVNCILDLSGQAVVEELIIRPMLGDYYG